jgi:uncharacterized protein GlcG (DUF336 family)
MKLHLDTLWLSHWFCRLATATLEACRAEGVQVAVVVADRTGIIQVLLRDRFAGPHTVNVATNKAWTTVSFRAGYAQSGTCNRQP